MDLRAKDFAYIKKPQGGYVLGLGPFEEAAEHPHTGIAFYVNHYDLSDPKPWKIPAEVHDVTPREFEGLDVPQVTWESPNAEDFAKVFSSIAEHIDQKTLEKSVPVVTEVGTLLNGFPEAFMSQLHSQSAHVYPYAWRVGQSGFCGKTPEMLFHLRKGRLKTMALAGTARAEEADIFAFDDKEIREHEYVTQALVQSLSDVGMVECGERKIMHLGSIVHFHTPIEVFMYGDHSMDSLIRTLHPTPALGPLPCTEANLNLLYEWRSRLGAPPAFGAPFGLYENGEFHALVAIRGIHWEGDQIAVPSGCGVIEESRLTNEWRELELKREAVKSHFL